MGDPECVVYADGVFDLPHWGHFNALRQARAFGTKLVVGVTSDEEVFKAKGMLPVYNSAERATIIAACQWVDEVIRDVPYDVDLEFFKLTKCDIVAHGDDIALNGAGEDSYRVVRKAGLLRTFKRSPGISTSNILYRVLQSGGNLCSSGSTNGNLCSPSHSHLGDLSDIFDAFRAAKKTGKVAGKITFTYGSFDPITAADIQHLTAAKNLGNYLLVGVLDTKPSQNAATDESQILTVFERGLALLGLRIVDDVILGVRLPISFEIFQKYNIAIVATRSEPELNSSSVFDTTADIQCAAVNIPSSNIETDVVKKRVIKAETQILKSVMTRFL